MTVYVYVKIKNTFSGVFCRLISQEKTDYGLTEKLPYDNFKDRIGSGRQTLKNNFAGDKLSDEKSTHTGMMQRNPGWCEGIQDGMWKMASERCSRANQNNPDFRIRFTDA